MSDVTIYHNPRCTKSRATLALLEGRGVKAKVVEYLTNPPSAAELRALVQKLGIRAEQLVRRGEDVFKEKYAGQSLTDDQWIEALAKNPVLIERPIVVRGDKAVIGRPPENANALFS